MEQAEPKGASVAVRGAWMRIVAALVLFAIGYAIANRFQLAHGVLYRFAAGDGSGGIVAFLFMAFQAAMFLAALLIFPRRWVAALLALAGGSILVNLGYTQIIPELVDGGTLVWMIAEVRQAGHAAGQFGATFLWAGLQVAAALVLFVAARRLVRRMLAAP